MNKFFNYVRFGKGIGAIWLLLYSLVIAVFIGVGTKNVGNDMVPTLQNVADQLLPIKVENGTIVEPKETVKAVKLDIEGVVVPIILDTTIDSIDVTNFKPGIYISRQSAYVVGPTKTQIYPFEGSIFLEQRDYTDLFRKYAAYLGVMFGILSFVVLFVIYLAIAALNALFTVMVAKLFKLNLSYDGGMRLSAVTYVITSILMSLLQYAHLSTPISLYVIAAVALQVIVLKAMASNK